MSPSLVLESRAEETAMFRASPVISAVVSILGAAIAVTAAYAALAIAASLAMAGTARSTEAAHLRALGLTRRQGILLVVAEHGSTIVIGFVAGTLLGLWLFGVLQPGLGLAMNLSDLGRRDSPPVAAKGNRKCVRCDRELPARSRGRPRKFCTRCSPPASHPPSQEWADDWAARLREAHAEAMARTESRRDTGSTSLTPEHSATRSQRHAYIRGPVR